jgi:hypothetical protein
MPVGDISLCTSPLRSPAGSVMPILFQWTRWRYRPKPQRCPSGAQSEVRCGWVLRRDSCLGRASWSPHFERQFRASAANPLRAPHLLGHSTLHTPIVPPYTHSLCGGTYSRDDKRACNTAEQHGAQHQQTCPSGVVGVIVCCGSAMPIRRDHTSAVSGLARACQR